MTAIEPKLLHRKMLTAMALLHRWMLVRPLLLKKVKDRLDAVDVAVAAVDAIVRKSPLPVHRRQRALLAPGRAMNFLATKICWLAPARNGKSKKFSIPLSRPSIG